jgi:hypothetical protein
MDRCMIMVIWSFHPHNTPLPLRACRLLGRPINHKLGCAKASDCGKDNLAWWMLLSLALVQ